MAVGLEAAATEVDDPIDHDVTGSKLVELLKEMRRDFAEAVKQSGQRVVIMIDDLDRVEPAKAVELLEVIKIFLETDNCVFVLAIDVEVVELGVQQRYGDGITSEKAKAFFEKIIQTPFRVPVHAYDFEYLFDGFAIANDKNGVVQRLARFATGNNPRATKRLLNAHDLNSRILKASRNDEDQESTEDDTRRFAIRCLELGLPDVYTNLLTSEGGKDNYGEEFTSIVARSNREESSRENSFLQLIQKAFTDENKSFDKNAFNRAVIETPTDSNETPTDVFANDRESIKTALHDFFDTKWDGVVDALVDNAGDSITLTAQPASPTWWTIRSQDSWRRIGFARFNKSSVVVGTTMYGINQITTFKYKDKTVAEFRDDFVSYLPNPKINEDSLPSVALSKNEDDLQLGFSTPEAAKTTMDFLRNLFESQDAPV